MLKVRLIAVVVIKSGHVVQSVNFKRYLPVASPEITVDYLNKWGIDEIILIDIDRSIQGGSIDTSLISKCAASCQVPMTIGGGIRTIEDVENIVKSGADKIVINSAFHTNPELITDSAKIFGNQCVVVSLDIKSIPGSGYKVFSHNGRNLIDSSLQDILKKAQESGAGEIFLNSIDRDGTKQGYDLELYRYVAEHIDIPIILCGGVGHFEDFLKATKQGVNAVAAANIFHFSEQSVILAKRYLINNAANVRCDTYASYENIVLDNDCRVLQPNEDYLEQLRFEYVPQEVI